MAKQLEKMNCSVLEDHDNRPATAEPAPQPPATRRKERPNLSAPQEDTWSPESIRILLDVWASSDIQSMRIAGKKLRNICKGIANRLQMQGVQCSWVQCRNMMLSLEDMYWSIQEANQNKQGDPIIHPFHEGLEKVLPFIYACPEGHKDEPKVYEPSGKIEENGFSSFTLLRQGT
ncbi:putative uncharacterized protein MSANTD5 [Monodelphis domestica]|uniref:putative uncharacterized protein MSANTD5 n=1 Tax=Monodelphis domestica TaxID=13616 RepID=UPI0024E1DF3F|nr:putative uncharacterized protein MSANTD5 [Monodelphis domestica]